jgi:hypothetical protein
MLNLYTASGKYTNIGVKIGALETLLPLNFQANNAWHHIIIRVMSPSNTAYTEIYSVIDTVATTTASTATYTESATDIVTLGAYASGSPLNYSQFYVGKLKDFRVYSGGFMNWQVPMLTNCKSMLGSTAYFDNTYWVTRMSAVCVECASGYYNPYSTTKSSCVSTCINGTYFNNFTQMCVFANQSVCNALNFSSKRIAYLDEHDDDPTKIYLVLPSVPLPFDTNINISSLISLKIPSLDTSGVVYTYKIAQGGPNNELNQFCFTITTEKAWVAEDPVIVTIADTSQFMDSCGHVLVNGSYTTPLLDYYVMSGNEKALLAALTGAAQGMQVGIAGSAAPLLMSGGLFLIWNILDAMQVLSYIMCIDVIFPANVYQFFLVFQNAQLAFLPNFFTLILGGLGGTFPTQVTPRNFYLLGYDAFFLGNCGMYVTAIILAYLLIVIIDFLESKVPEKYKIPKFIARLIKRFVKYNLLLRACLATYMQFPLFTFLQFYVVDFASPVLVINNFLWISALMYTIILPFFLFFILFKNKNTYTSDEMWRNGCDTLFDDCKTIAMPHRFFTCAMLFRSLFSMLFLVSCYYVPYAVVAMHVLLAFVMLVALGFFRPFRRPSLTVRNVIQECCFFFIYVLIFLILDPNYNKEDKSNIGWGIIILALVILVMNILFILWDLLVGLKDLYTWLNKVWISKFGSSKPPNREKQYRRFDPDSSYEKAPLNGKVAPQQNTQSYPSDPNQSYNNPRDPYNPNYGNPYAQNAQQTPGQQPYGQPYGQPNGQTPGQNGQTPGQYGQTPGQPVNQTPGNYDPKSKVPASTDPKAKVQRVHQAEEDRNDGPYDYASEASDDEAIAPHVLAQADKGFPKSNNNPAKGKGNPVSIPASNKPNENLPNMVPDTKANNNNNSIPMNNPNSGQPASSTNLDRMTDSEDAEFNHDNRKRVRGAGAGGMRN